MPYPQFDRSKLNIKPLSARKDKVYIERDHVPVDAEPAALSDSAQAVIDETVKRLKAAKATGKSRMLTFGAHAIKNGLAPVMIKLIEDGWFTHLATNGAGIIHDWEFAFQGHSSEDVRENVSRGEFGVWQETGHNINLAIIAGAFRGMGYGESVGAFVENEGIDVPSIKCLKEQIGFALEREEFDFIAAASDLLDAIIKRRVSPGWHTVPHPFKQYGLQAAAYRLKVPFTSHPMIGHDIIYVHPMNKCAAIGRAAERDFLAFAQSVSNLDGGVYVSIGSAVMSPMIFEKSLSMSQNLAIQRGEHIDDHFMVIVDLQESHWDWTQGEPPMDNPDYYLRYNKSFNRMGGRMRYVTADNRDFLLALVRALDAQ
ncbi:MAG TPA: hypothetical protein PKO36_00620 [Candidatus Hydrogenedentes bacterium]|nr:hypothetical protein [Candidatus Hydrogenedentota bacterium]HOV75187.1 hypothetical protein [Candidatus Hydrogenedentota bacterium]